jgi:hypothetical protein
LLVIDLLVVEILVVGSEPGLMRWLQIVFFASGLTLVALAVWPSSHSG